MLILTTWAPANPFARYAARGPLTPSKWGPLLDCGVVLVQSLKKAKRRLLHCAGALARDAAAAAAASCDHRRQEASLVHSTPTHPRPPHPLTPPYVTGRL